jgi:hypothetical protein
VIFTLSYSREVSKMKKEGFISEDDLLVIRGLDPRNNPNRPGIY